MQQVRYSFPEVSLDVVCREPHQAATQRTLTWLIGEEAAGSSACRVDPVTAHQAQAEGSRAEWGLDWAAAISEDSGDHLGLDIWPASDFLCQYVGSSPQIISTATQAVELGAGVGLAGLLTARLGAKSVVLTDYEDKVLTVLKHNIALNGVSASCSTARLDWFNPVDLQALKPCSLALAADVLYTNKVVLPFAKVVQELLDGPGLLLLAHQTRRSIMRHPKTGLPCMEDTDVPLERFLEAMRQHGFIVQILSGSTELQVGDSKTSAAMLLLALSRSQHTLSSLPQAKP